MSEHICKPSCHNPCLLDERNPYTAPVAPSRSAAPKDDPICINCGEPESNHAMIGDWCRSESTDAIWSTTRKFRQASVAPTEAAPPSEREALELVLHVLNSAPKQGWDKWRKAVDIVEGWQARAAVPQAPLAELLQPLKDACDRDWKDETPEQIVSIAANAIYWRGRAAAVPAPGRELEVLASALKKVLPPTLLNEVVSYCDGGFSEFLAFLRAGATAPPKEG